MFVRGLHFCLRRGSKRNLALMQLHLNLKNQGIVSEEYYSNCAREEISLPVDRVKKYIKRIADEYEKKNVIDTEMSSKEGYSQVTELLESRTVIAESMKSLEELAQEDAEMKKLGEEELTMYRKQMDELDNRLLEAILHNIGRDNHRDILLEIMTGVGGQESMLFARNLFDMYLGYLKYLQFEHEVLQQDVTTVGGIRYAVIAITGARALEIFRHEGGVHRVQRIPATEKSGRIHTSTVSVAVLPQPTDIDIDLKEKDLKIETKNASGAGGQHVNKTESAVRITHLPTGICVESQTDRSQIKNRQIAMLQLRTKIYEIQIKEQRTTSGELRKKQVGLGLRNEKIRTYNFNQDRITDHRIINGTTHNLKGFLEGGEDLEELQNKLQRQLQIKLLQEAIEKVTK